MASRCETASSTASPAPSAASNCSTSSATSAPPPPTVRKRRAHQKSRRGCAPCKLRRVKCDEAHPICKRCTSSSFACHYPLSLNPPSLPHRQRHDALEALPREGMMVLDLRTTSAPPSTTSSARIPSINSISKRQSIPAVPTRPPIQIPIIGPSGRAETYSLPLPDEAILFKFHTRTVLTLSSVAGATLFQRAYSRLAPKFPFLVHVMLTLSMLEERTVQGKLGNPVPSFANTSAKAGASRLAFHYYQAAASFSAKIAHWSADSLSRIEADAYWAAAMLLSVATFAVVDHDVYPKEGEFAVDGADRAFSTTSVEETWPLRPTHDSDLAWLRMVDGKSALVYQCDPSNPESTFYYPPFLNDAREAFGMIDTNEDIARWTSLPPKLISMCLQRAKTIQATTQAGATPRNPYARALNMLAPLVADDCCQGTIIKYLAYVNHMDADMKALLRGKDVAALVMLSYWYAKLLPYDQWWIRCRVPTELQAIVLYLEREHGRQATIAELLGFPKAALFDYHLES